MPEILTLACKPGVSKRHAAADHAASFPDLAGELLASINVPDTRRTRDTGHTTSARARRICSGCCAGSRSNPAGCRWCRCLGQPLRRADHQTRECRSARRGAELPVGAEGLPAEAPRPLPMSASGTRTITWPSQCGQRPFLPAYLSLTLKTCPLGHSTRIPMVGRPPEPLRTKYFDQIRQSPEPHHGHVGNLPRVPQSLVPEARNAREL